MQKRIVRFVQFFMPGTFFAESWTQDIDSFDPHSIQWPENAYMFSLHKREDIVDNDKVYKGETKKVGPNYYHPDSKVKTFEEVREEFGEDAIIVRNMECNHWDRLIFTRWGNWPQPFDDTTDVVLKHGKEDVCDICGFGIGDCVHQLNTDDVPRR